MALFIGMKDYNMFFGSPLNTNCASGFGCKGETIHIPSSEPCDDCSAFQQELNILKDRVRILEIILEGASVVTDEEKAFWNNKVTAYIASVDHENLILSKE